MRFMMIYKPDDVASLEAGSPPTEDEMTRMGEFIEEVAREGVLVLIDGLQASSTGARVRRTKGRITVEDGPFTETKELIGGFAIVNVTSKAQAVELAKRFLAVAGDGESEIRLMYDQPAYEAPH
jgi:hypothetical protein